MKVHIFLHLKQIIQGKNKKQKNNEKTYKRRNNHRKTVHIEKKLFSNKNNDDNENNIYGNNSKKEFDLDNEYYKVNINRIKFMIYDFNKGMVITSKIEKKSQIENIIENYKLRNSINICEEPNYPNISIEKFKKEAKNKSKNSEINIKRKILGNNENKKIFDKEKEFEKEISYALSIQDEQKSIIHFYTVSIISMLIILLMCFYEIFFMIYKYSTLRENLKLIIYAANLKYITNMGIYLIREKTLFTISNNITGGIYNIPDSNSENYIMKISNFTKDIFIESNSILEYIIGTNFKFCNKTKHILTEVNFNFEVLYNETYIKNTSNSFYTSILHIFSSFCNLLTNSNYIYIDDQNLYNFIHNSFNILGNMLNIQLELFENELELRENSIKINIIIISVIYLILYIIIYLVICTSYFSIVQKKASYISVFYGIGLSLIKSSIKKCEIFINKINQNCENVKMKDIDEETSSIISSIEDINLNKIFMENNFVNLNENKKKLKNLKKNRKLGDDKKSKQFKFLYQLFLIFSYLYITIIFFTFLILTKKFINCGKYIYYMQDYQNNIIELFNGFREYLFDENTIIFGLPAYNYLITKEQTIYSTNTENRNNLTILAQNIKGLYKNSFIFKEKEFCNPIFSYFNTKEDCIDFIGGENGILSLGFNLLVNSFIEEIRNARNFVKILLDQKVLVGNLSEYIEFDRNDTYYNLDKNNNLIFRMRVFNEIHSRLNIIFINIIFQFIIQEKNTTIQIIEESTINGHLIYLICIGIYVFIFVIIFLFYWIPMIKSMNSEIYKTKKMLTIIPTQILASQPNIKELLNISLNNS